MIKEMDKEPNFYAIIPATVRYDKNITANAKLLYGEITALCNAKGFCWASNRYFSELYNVSLTSISKWVSQLLKGGYIEVDMSYKEDTKEIEFRCITLPVPHKEKLKGYGRKVKGGIEEKLRGGIEEKLKDNNTVLLNNTLNNTYYTKTENFEEILNPTSFPNWRNECISFLNDNYFKKNCSKDFQLPIGNLEEIMRNFVKKLNLENDFKNVAAIKKHFVHHYKKHRGVNNYTAFTGSSGFVEIPENQDFSEIDQRFTRLD